MVHNYLYGGTLLGVSQGNSTTLFSVILHFSLRCSHMCFVLFPLVGWPSNTTCCFRAKPMPPLSRALREVKADYPNQELPFRWEGKLKISRVSLYDTYFPHSPNLNSTLSSVLTPVEDKKQIFKIGISSFKLSNIQGHRDSWARYLGPKVPVPFYPLFDKSVEVDFVLVCAWIGTIKEHIF